ncbi:MAG: histidine kinase dimerization/phospho-acceptor domain-containing protein [Gammaproteobacteria bacterium]|nr:histidine kinase dimerization/phospho-acceptor domain-containing protein [Gammaproteobacteria bacterium]
MWHNLYNKLAIGLTLILLLVGLLYVGVVLSINKNNSLSTDQALNRELAKHLVAERNLVAENRINQAALKKAFMYYMNINPSIEIYLLDLQGKILSYSAEPGKVKLNRISLAPLHEFFAAKNFPILGDDPRNYGKQKVFSVTPVPNKQNPEGYLYVILRGEQFDAIEVVAKNKRLLTLSIWLIGVSLGIGLLVGLLGVYFITRRLKLLSQSADVFSQSGFSQAVPLSFSAKNGDEIDRLAETFNHMSAKIVQQLKSLKKQDEARCEMVANISHDLRTPLAALHGYIETLILKQASLTAEQQQHYLKSALNNSVRLSQLIDELFELARLESAETKAKMEPFSIAELASDVIQQYAPIASEQNNRLSMECFEAPPFVSADIGMIQRVLENLISNGLRHTENGAVVLSLSKAHEKNQCAYQRYRLGNG